MISSAAVSATSASSSAITVPADVPLPPIHLLGSSGYSAQLAGVLGLRFAYAHHFDSGGTLPALELYRRRFAPSPVLDRPHVIVTANVLVADTDEEAQRLALPGRLMMLAIRTNRLRPIPSQAEAEADPERAAAEAMPTNWIVGAPDRAADELRQLAADTGADEIMVTSNTHGVTERVHSLELLARAWGLPQPDRQAA